MAKKVKKKATKKPTKKAAKKPVKKAAKKKPAKKAIKKKASAKPAKAKSKPAPKPIVKTVVKVVEKIVEKIVNVFEPAKKTTSVNAYITFNGNCEEAFGFYKSVFGGDFPYIGRFNEMPPAEGQPPMSESEGQKIMHMSLPIGANSILMGSDSSDAYGQATIVGNNFSISVNTLNDKEADRIFNGLSSGGIVAMPMAKTFWGSYFGMCVDKYGIQWMVSHEEPKEK